MRSRRLLLLSAVAVVLVAAATALALPRLGRGGDPSPAPADEATRLLGGAAVRRTATDVQIETLQSRLSRKAPDPNLLATLGEAYLQKARETANPSWYARAETVLKQALGVDPGNAEALHGMGALALARHQFAEALDWGQRAVQAAPYRAANYGIVGDALIELGRYEEAVPAIQKMVDTRPDLASYARVSHLRELYGRVDGAIEAMQRAVAAGGPGENTAYTRVLLGNLYLGNGRPDEAEREYLLTLQRSPGYGPAQAGLAYVRAARGDDAGAIFYLSRAVESLPLPEYVIALGDLYARTGRADEARRQYELVRAIERLYTAAGTDVDVESALFAADHDSDIAGALARARDGYARRPSIHAADVLAWTLYKAGQPEEAAAYAREALRLGTKDALKLFHAGMIAHALGKNDEARAYLEQALAINPHFSLLHAATARETLAALGGTTPPAGAARSRP
jgi:tetratricopeptide (TPR) repeat protein